MTVLLRLPNEYAQKDQFGVFDDFDWLISPHRWTTTLSDSGSVTVANGTGGIAPIVPSDGSVADNDESYLYTTNKPFKFADGKPIFVAGRFQFTEANTDDANVAFGLASTIGANNIVDDGAGLLTTFDGFGIYKVDGGTVWKCITSKGTSQTITTSTTTAGGSAYVELIMEFKPITSTYAEVHFFVGDTNTALLDTNLKAIVHRFDYSSTPLAMGLWAGAKNGFTNLETLNCDWMGAWQKR